MHLFLNLFYLLQHHYFCKFVNHDAETEKLLMIGAAERGGRGCEEREECKKKGDCDERRE